MTLTTSRARMALDDIRARRAHALTEDDIVELLELKVKYDEMTEEYGGLREKLEDALENVQDLRSEAESLERTLEYLLQDSLP